MDDSHLRPADEPDHMQVTSFGMPRGLTVLPGRVEVNASKIGARVNVAGFGPGVLRYYGRHASKPGYRCGVELDQANGLNNGTVQGYYYFECKEGFGVLVDPRKVSLEQRPTGGAAAVHPSQVTLQTSLPSGARAAAMPDGPEDLTVDIKSFLAQGHNVRSAQMAYLEQQLEHAREEFKQFAKSRRDSQTSIASHEAQRSRNRYIDILPYDDTRVSINGNPESDYINASYVHIGMPPHSYSFVCSQGPLPQTIEDTWLMVLEQQIRVIVMLTSLEEGGRRKCALYWPTAAAPTLDLARVAVRYVSAEQHAPGILITTLELIHKQSNTRRTVSHVHYTAWPDHGVPAQPTEFLSAISCVAALQSAGATTAAAAAQVPPVLVHCSAGIGRTGVFVVTTVALDKLARQLIPDIPEILRVARAGRAGMVQTADQYAFIFQAALAKMGSSEWTAGDDAAEELSRV